jgi:hypothetical protein
MMAEAGAVVMEGAGHGSGTLLPTTVHFEKGIERLFAVEYDDVTEQMRQSYREPVNAVEQAAYGVAILLAQELLGVVVVQQGLIGDGIDYWLGSGEGDYPFQNTARLEVSGTRSSDRTELRERVREKLKQMAPTDDMGPGYVAVIAFGLPAAEVVKKQ